MQDGNRNNVKFSINFEVRHVMIMKVYNRFHKTE